MNERMKIEETKVGTSRTKTTPAKQDGEAHVKKKQRCCKDGTGQYIPTEHVQPRRRLVDADTAVGSTASVTRNNNDRLKREDREDSHKPKSDESEEVVNDPSSVTERRNRIKIEPGVEEEEEEAVVSSTVPVLEEIAAARVTSASIKTEEGRNDENESGMKHEEPSLADESFVATSNDDDTKNDEGNVTTMSGTEAKQETKNDEAEAEEAIVVFPSGDERFGENDISGKVWWKNVEDVNAKNEGKLDQLAFNCIEDFLPEKETVKEDDTENNDDNMIKDLSQSFLWRVRPWRILNKIPGTKIINDFEDMWCLRHHMTNGEEGRYIIQSAIKNDDEGQNSAQYWNVLDRAIIEKIFIYVINEPIEHYNLSLCCKEFALLCGRKSLILHTIYVSTMQYVHEAYDVCNQFSAGAKQIAASTTSQKIVFDKNDGVWIGRKQHRSSSTTSSKRKIVRPNGLGVYNEEKIIKSDIHDNEKKKKKKKRKKKQSSKKSKGKKRNSTNDYDDDDDDDDDGSGEGGEDVIIRREMSGMFLDGMGHEYCCEVIKKVAMNSSSSSSSSSKKSTDNNNDNDDSNVAEDVETYVGQMDKNMRHGFGTHTKQSADGQTRYEGRWENDVRQGYGLLIGAYWSFSYGRYEKDEPVGTHIAWNACRNCDTKLVEMLKGS